MAMIVMAALAFCALTAGAALAGSKRDTKTTDNPLDKPMVFAIVRSNAGYCEPNCPEWIQAEGQIDATTPKAFRKILKKAGDRKLPLLILSPGGNVTAALEVGRMVRDRKMVVEVAATRFETCHPRNTTCKSTGPVKGEYRGMAFVGGAFCWSACPLILAAGVERYSSSWSMTGVHQVTTVYQREKVIYKESYKIVNGKKKVLSRKIVSRKKAGTQSSTKLPKKTRRELTTYFAAMGIKKDLLALMLSTPPDKIRKLEPAEMLDLKLITRLSSTDLLADPALCAVAKPPAQCIFREPAAAAPDTIDISGAAMLSAETSVAAKPRAVIKPVARTGSAVVGTVPDSP